MIISRFIEEVKESAIHSRPPALPTLSPKQPAIMIMNQLYQYFTTSRL